MYTETQEGSEELLDLNEQLEQDESGAVRDRLIDELQVTAGEIKAALGGEPGATAAAARVLKGLLEAVTLSESVLIDVWNAFHGPRAGSASVLLKR